MFGENKGLKFLIKEFPHYQNSGYPTSVGVWEPSNLDVLFDIFKKIKLGQQHTFLDAGSGDGRVVFLASLFCNSAIGIEADPVLHFISSRKLEKHPFFHQRAVILKEDYLEHDFSMYDVIFNYADGRVSKEMQRKCIDEMQPGSIGVFYVYNPYLPGTVMLEKKTPVWLFRK